jgi:hypothetical protein
MQQKIVTGLPVANANGPTHECLQFLYVSRSDSCIPSHVFKFWFLCLRDLGRLWEDCVPTILQQCVSLHPLPLSLM